MRRRVCTITLALGCLIFVNACVTAVEERGYVIDKEAVAKIKAGMKEDDVRRVLGSPSSISELGEKTWYYIGLKQEKTPFSSPDIVKKDIVKVAFDAQNQVSSVAIDDQNNHRSIDFAKDETQTEGNQVGVIEQLIGNVGRFNASKEAE